MKDCLIRTLEIVTLSSKNANRRKKWSWLTFKKKTISRTRISNRNDLAEAEQQPKVIRVASDSEMNQPWTPLEVERAEIFFEPEQNPSPFIKPKLLKMRKQAFSSNTTELFWIEPAFSSEFRLVELFKIGFTKC